MGNGQDNDPALAAIAAHKAAFEAFAAADENAPAYGELDEAEMAALDALLDTPPATLAGARSAIEWLIEWEARMKRPWPDKLARYLATLLKSPALK